MKYLTILLAVTFFTPQVSAEVIQIVSRPSTIQEKVEATFWDTPRIVDIVKCESGFKQFDSNGNALRSPTSDIGVMQINKVHWQEAKDLGLDIWNSASDNIRMGRIILDKQGIGAWVCNKLV